MRVRILQLLDDLRSSFWFLPTLMALGAILLALVLTRADEAYAGDAVEALSWLYANRPEGARAVLSTIAGSMITVAGVVFSVTVAALAYASSQFGPYLLYNFMQHRGNQLTLGTFVATFLYCLLVLRTVRSASGEDDDLLPASLAAPFVPHLSVMVAMLLAMASIGVLIYFIHHVTESLQPTSIVGGIGRELHGHIDRLFPEQLGFPPPPDHEPPPEGLAQDAVPVEARGTGYIQQLDTLGLLRLASTHDLVVLVVRRPGDFVVNQRVLALAWPAERVTPAAVDRLQACFAQGQRRTAAQDAMFLVDELVQIASRALSPSLNDPFTAMTCLDWLGSALVTLARRQPPPAHRHDDAGRLRVIVRPLSFAGMASAVFDQLRPYISRDRNVAVHAMTTLATLVAELPDPGVRAQLVQQATALRIACERELPDACDLDLIHQRYRALRHAAHLSEEEGAAAAADAG